MRVRIALACLLLAGCDTSGSPLGDAVETARNARALAFDEAESRLGQLPISDAGRPYDRDDWPEDSDIRLDILTQESEVPITLTRTGRVATGRWVSRYTGQVYTDARALDVDHLVSLADVHRSGGWSWTEERRRAYANDTEGGLTLNAVESGLNRSKGDRGPEAWLPANHEAACAYARDYITVKAEWGLSVTTDQAESLETVLETCA